MAELAPKDAYCLACLPAIYQQHVLAPIPTGIVLSNVLAQLAAGGRRVGEVVGWTPP